MKDRRERCDLEAGMAKLFASETAHAVAVGALRLHGEAGTLTRLTVERHYRDTPLMIIGEGTNEIQRTLIARQLVERYGERLGALTSRDGEPEERRQLVLAVRQFVDKSLVPAVAEHEPAGRYPEAIVRELGALGLLGAVGRSSARRSRSRRRRPRRCSWRSWPAAGSRWPAPWPVTSSVPGRSSASLRPPSATPGCPPSRAATSCATAVLGGDVRARRAPEWTLSGTTALADNAPRAALVPDRGHAPRTDARRLALVERGARGLRVGEPESPLGGRGLDPCPLVLDDARPTLLLESDAAAEATGAFAGVAAAAIAIGLAQAAFEAALRYSQQRTTFGKPLCQHQAVQLKLADMATGITAGRLLTYHAAAAGTDGDARARVGGDGAAARRLGRRPRDPRDHADPRRVRLRERVPRRALLPRRRAAGCSSPLDDEQIRRELAARLSATA